MAVQISVTADRLADLPARMTKASKELIDAAEEALDEYGALLVLAIDQQVPKREGSTAQSLNYVIKGRGTRSMEMQIRMGATNRPKGLVEWLRFGTGIYGPNRTPIVPKRAKFLVFEIGGRTIFTKSVKGMKGYDFIQGGWDMTASQRRSVIARIGRLGLTMLGDSR